ncbi:hypothetical protein FIBSPDRAFT_921248 [Athelia psychrophila]|uniref:General negative regulator of transcription subunit n=1 Tax=Athelia psychrophila TaxID=1759441 RepID=A0A166DWU6_9AGAM|nr:hypothetical protein FIBSPDRAFT_921248 [Fibularhizoctonia sp. CBS 109695]
MAARKLQTEIDRTLKKVSEGVELFESIYDKMQASTNQTQKEKLETDLKTQIKKLQRLRDQIKTWVASNDIKDKSSLLDNRKLIETQMEKFKACEKEMKTKAFSKEGLIASAKLDPKQQAKQEITDWVQGQVENLQMQVEQTDAEIESLQGTGKKRGKANSGRLEDLEGLNDRRKWHISRLEIILRLLDNGSMVTERVVGLKEDVNYFVESNTEEDFEEDEGIYDELDLDEEEAKFGLAAEEDDDSGSESASEDLPPRTPSKRHDRDEDSMTSGSRRDDSPILKKAQVPLQLRKSSLAADTRPPPNLNFAQQPMASVLKAGLPAAPPRPPTKGYSAAAAAAVTMPPSGSAVPVTPSLAYTPATAATYSTPPAPTAPSITASSSIADHHSGVSLSPSLTHPSVTSPMLSSASVSHQPDGSFYSGEEFPSPAMSEPAATSSPQRIASRQASDSLPQVATQPVQAPEPVPLQSQQNDAPLQAPPGVPQGSAPSPLPQQVQQYQAGPLGMPSRGSSPAPNTIQPQFPPGVKVLQTEQQHNMQVPQQSIGAQRSPSVNPSHQVPSQPPQRPTSSAFPGSLSDLVVSFENVKQKATHRMTHLDQVQKLLESGYSSVPQPQDTEKPKYYVPRNPFQTPEYYPQAQNPVLSTTGIFSQLDVETLFYVFYFLPGTYQQYLAAKELKRQSWRFHVKYLTWFQRHSEPQAITEEYEQGVYVYFDWEGSWCQRKKSDFRFEYRYLSED